MDALSLAIEENRIANPHFGESGGRRRVEPSADQRPPAGDERECDRTAASGAPVARGDVAEHAHRHRLRRVGDDLRALLQDILSVLGHQADQLLAPWRDEIRPRERAAPDEVRLGPGDQPCEPHVVGRHRAVGLLADHDEALLRAQHVHRLGAVGGDAEGLPALDHGLPHRLPVVGGHIDLVAQLARERDAEQPARHPADGTDAHRHVGKRLPAEVDAVDEGRQDLARLRPLQRRSPHTAR